VVIINQQVPSGIHTEYLRNGIVRVIQNHPDKIFIVDSRDFSDFYAGSCRKLNDLEATRLCGIQRGPDEPVSRQETLDAARTLYQRFQKPCSSPVEAGVR
jgi:hypothetical protein